MQITEVRIFKLKERKGKLVANCSITFDESLVVKGKVLEGSKGMFVGFKGQYGKENPETGDKTWYSDVIVLNQELRSEINETVLGKLGEVSGSPQRTDTNNTFNTNDNYDIGEDDSIPF